MRDDHIPPGFRYRDVLKQGKPQHTPDDAFYIRHPPMSRAKRAKIFAPFDALRGFGDAVRSKEVSYVEKRALSEDERDALDRKLAVLSGRLAGKRAGEAADTTVQITYFQPCSDPHADAHLPAGLYKTITGTCHEIRTDRTIRIDEYRISIDAISGIRLDGS